MTPAQTPARLHPLSPSITTRFEDGRCEELELEEICECLEPPAFADARLKAGGSEGAWSAPQLARATLAARRVARGDARVDAERASQPPPDRFVARPEVLQKRKQANARLLACFKEQLPFFMSQREEPWWFA